MNSDYIQNGRLTIFLGITPGTEKTLAMMHYAHKRYAQGDKVYVLDISVSYHTYYKQLDELLQKTGQMPGRIPGPDVLNDETFVEGLIEERPALVVLGAAVREGLDIEANANRLQFIERLRNNGIDVATTVNVYQIENVPLVTRPPIDYPQEATLSRKFLMQANHIEFIDKSPMDTLKEFFRDDFIFPPVMEKQKKLFLSVTTLELLRQSALQLVFEHAKARTRSGASFVSFFATLAGFMRLPSLRDFLNETVLAAILLFVITAGGFGVLRYTDIPLHQIGVAYMGGAAIVAAFANFYTSSMATVMAFLLYRYFFVQPLGLLAIYSWQDTTLLMVYGATSVCISFALSRYRRGGLGDIVGQENKQKKQILFDFVRDSFYAEKPDDVLRQFMLMLEKRTALSSAAVLFNPATREVNSTLSTEELSNRELEDFRQVFEKKKRLQRFGRGWQYIYIPLSTAQECYGAIRFRLRPYQRHKRLFAEQMVRFAAYALERIILNANITDALIKSERESLRSALLSAISHDLKTPLVSIIGSLSTVSSLSGTLDKETEKDLIVTSLNEAKRLNQFITNILEIAKLESGAVVPKREFVDIHQLVEDTTQRLRMKMGSKKLLIEIPDTFPEIEADPVLLGQVIYNLVDNALNYTPENCTIEITGSVVPTKPADSSLAPWAGGALICVSDSGHGIESSMANKLFDKFFRPTLKDNKVAGTGLGLAICKGIMQAHGGDIKAGNRSDGVSGAVFTLMFKKEHTSHVKHAAA